MAHTFEYAVLTAIPDPRRGERVNLGVVVFGRDHLDVRLEDAGVKLRALTGETWDARLTAIERRIASLFEAGVSAKDLNSRIGFCETVVHPSALGSFAVDSDSDYERVLAEILQSLVILPKRERLDRQSRINTEIALHFRKVGIMAKKAETINDGKVVRNFPIAPEEGLSADFALKNGKLCVTSTLDLRKQTANLAEAALKSIILDKAANIYGDEVKRIGVYAADDEAEVVFRTHIELLKDYAESVYNWSDLDGQRGFKNAIFDALPSPFGRQI